MCQNHFWNFFCPRIFFVITCVFVFFYVLQRIDPPWKHSSVCVDRRKWRGPHAVPRHGDCIRTRKWSRWLGWLGTAPRSRLGLWLWPSARPRPRPWWPLWSRPRRRLWRPSAECRDRRPCISWRHSLMKEKAKSRVRCGDVTWALEQSIIHAKIIGIFEFLKNTVFLE